MQNQEIELKFGFLGTADDYQQLRQILYGGPDSTGAENLPGSEIKVDRLSNSFFDTPERDFFRREIGLRLRKAESYHEQTVKLGKSTVAALHVSREYNVRVPTDVNVPQLQLFPQELYTGTNADLVTKQDELKELLRFSFTRSTFNFTYAGGTTFEFALDQGEIVTPKRTLPISELEMELNECSLEGQDLLFFMISLIDFLEAANVPLTLEPLSKMHRATLMNFAEAASFEPKLNLALEPGQEQEWLMPAMGMFERHLGRYYIFETDAELRQCRDWIRRTAYGFDALCRRCDFTQYAEQIGSMFSDMEKIFSKQLARGVHSRDRLKEILCESRTASLALKLKYLINELTSGAEE